MKPDHLQEPALSTYGAEPDTEAARANPLNLTPEEAGMLAGMIRNWMQAREEKASQERRRRLRAAAFPFSLFPTRRNVDYKQEAQDSVRQSWQHVGDCLRLAMLDYEASKRK